jgi:hypothetical protein
LTVYELRVFRIVRYGAGVGLVGVIAVRDGDISGHFERTCNFDSRRRSWGGSGGLKF